MTSDETRLAEIRQAITETQRSLELAPVYDDMGLSMAHTQAIDRLEECRTQLDAQAQTIRELHGAIAAQDAREHHAGDVCGVSREIAGCDWPDVMADRVMVLAQTIATLTHTREVWKAKAEAREARLTRLTDGLRTYGHHFDRCDLRKDKPHAICDCGLFALLADPETPP